MALAAFGGLALLSVGAVPSAVAVSRTRNLPALVVDAPSAAVAPGESFNVRVLLTASTSTAIRFTLSGLPVGSSATLSSVSSRERRIRVGIPATADPGIYEGRFRTTNPGLKRTDTFTVSVTSRTPVTIPVTSPPTSPPVTIAPIAPAFQLASPENEQVVRLGTLISLPIQISRQNQWVGPVRLVVEGLPAGTTAAFLPFNPTSDPSSDFRILVPATTAPGDYTLRITGTAGDLTRLLPILLKVRGQETISMVVVSGGRAQVARTSQIGNVDVNVVNGDGGEVTLSAEQLPAGIVITFDKNPVLGSTGMNATVTPSFSPNAIYNFVVVARKGSITTKSTASLRVVPTSTPPGLRYVVTPVTPIAGEPVGFGLSAIPSAIVMTRGSSAQVSVTITPQGGFNQAIDFALVGVPAGVVGVLEPTSTANVIRLTLITSNSQPLASTTIKVRATSGGLASEIGLGFRVA
jgi:hypothetical protein